MNIGRKILALTLAVMCAVSLMGIQNVYAESDHEYRDEELVHPDNKALNGYDIVFVIDNSGSIWKEQDIRDKALHTVADLAVGSDVRIGAVYFGDHVSKTYKLTSVEDQDSYVDVINKGLTDTEKDESNRDTNIGEGLKAGLSLFEDQDTKRERIVILLSDGINENLQGSAAYKAQADKETKEQVKILKEKGYPLYCAFIEKEYGDADYLQQLVNYFGKGDTYDDRLVTVSDEDINMLADCMAGIFYDLNGGMKYKKLNLDSNGKDSFYIPALNVTKLQIYLNNEKGEATLTGPDGSEAEGWSEGTSSFFTVEDPTVGTWELSVNSDSAVTGTIAYYTDICLKSELVGNVMRNQSVTMNADFYNSDEESISLDETAEVSCSLSVGDGENKAKSAMTVKDTKGSSDETLAITEVGKVHGKIHIQYDEFIDLSYTVLKGKEIHTYGPEATDYTGNGLGLINAFPSGSMLKKSLKLKDYVTDPDSDLSDLTITDQTQGSEDHKATVSIEDGKLVITCADGKLFPAYVEGSVTLADADGQTTEFNYKGYMVNMTVVLIICLLLAALIFGGIYTTLQKRKKRKEMLSTFGGYVKSFKEQKAIASKNLEECEAMRSNETITGYVKDRKNLLTLLEELALPEAVKRILNIKEPADANTLQGMKTDVKAAYAQAAKVCEFAEQENNTFADYANMPNKELAERMRHVSTTVKNMIRENAETQKLMEKASGAEDTALPDAENVKDTLEFLTSMKDKRIGYNMALTIKRRTAVIMKNKTAFYSLLDDACMLNLDEEESLYDYYGVHTGIVFLPFEQKNGKTTIKGVIAVSDKPFASRDTAQSEDETQIDTSVVIPVGSTCRFEIEKIGTIFVEVQ